LRLKPAQNGYFLPKLIFFQKSSAWVKQKNFQDFEIGFFIPTCCSQAQISFAPK